MTTSVVTDHDHRAATELLKALANPIRLAIVEYLGVEPRCVHELVDELDVNQPLVSQHLRILRAARLVTTQRRGREIVYALSDEHTRQISRDALDQVREPRS